MTNNELAFVILAKDEFSAAFSKLNKVLGPLEKGALALGGAISAAGASLFAITKTTATTYDGFSKLSDQLGISTDFLSKLKYQTDIGGVAWGTATKAVQGFQVRIGEASQGIGTAKDSFLAMGIEINKENGQLKTAEELLPEVADALKNVTNATEKTEIAQKLFGQRGIEMLQIMGEGSAGMKELSEKAEAMGLVVSNVAAKQAAAFNDSLTNATGVIRGLKDSIGVQLMPIITGLANKFSDFAVDNRAKIIQFAKDAIKSMAAFAENGVYGVALLVDSFRGLQMTWDVIKIAFAEMSKTLWSGLDWLMQKMLSFMKAMNFRGIFDDAIANTEAFTALAQENIDAMTNMSEKAYKSLLETANQGTATEKVEEYKEYILNTLTELDEAGRVQVEAAIERDTEHTENVMANLIARKDAETQALKEKKDRENLQLKEQKEQEKLLLTEQTKHRQEEKDAEKEKQEYLDRLHKDSLFIFLLREQIKNKLAYEMDESQTNHLIETKEKAMDFLKKSGKKEFKIYQSMKSGEALINTYQAAIAAFQSLASIPIVGPALGAVAAGVAIAFGMQQVKSIQSQKFTAAHGGYTNVPSEQTMLLDKGERVLSPAQNRDLTSFLDSGGGSGGQTINIDIMPNVTNPDVMLRMSRSDWDNIVETNIIPSLKRLKTAGVTV